MKDILTKNRFTHWYDQYGNPMHETTGADGVKQVKVTLSHARKNGYYPSVTNILSLLKKEAVEDWKQEQLVKACMNLKRLDTESESDYVHRVVNEAFNKSTKALDFGSEVHYFIQDYLQGTMRATYSIKQETQNKIKEVLDKEIKEGVCEKPLVNKIFKYAGKRDCRSIGHDGKSTTWDFKTQGTVQGKKINSYDEWLMQIAAYDAVELSDCYKSLVISSTEPERVEVIEYSNEDIEEALKGFLGLREVFKFIKGV